MELIGIITDRHETICRLEKELGIRAEYMGAPGFIYKVGDYSVLRNGNIKVDDSKADRKLLEAMINDGMLQKAAPEAGKGKYEIGFQKPSSRTMVNIVNEISSRGWLIGKAVGNTEAIYVSPLLVKNIKKINPGTTTEFKDALYASGGMKAMRGVIFTDTSIRFTGFPQCSPDEEKAYRTLAEMMVKSAEEQKWVKPEQIKTENEKYTFRFWLNAIGMSGDQYKKTRQILLENLSGDAAFRTLKQKEEAMKKRKKNEKRSYPDFVVL